MTPPVIIHTVSAASWPQVATVVTAVFALLVSLGAFGFQLASWRRSGFRPRMRWFYLHDTGTRTCVIRISNRGRVAGELAEFQLAPEMTRSQVIAVAKSGGFWTRVRARIGNRRLGDVRTMPTAIEGKPLPYRLEPNATYEVRMPVQILVTTAAAFQNARLFPECRCGNDEVVRGQPFEVSPEYRQWAIDHPLQPVGPQHGTS
ncbi:hypothetical protein [uncultured Jatrophihabitans sp.]|uniref:hypothetical protein n=1 Tax=uncultured Jatrophihabitans sp. TaxID=1610747 RepID=UPI0035CC947F